MAAIIKSEVFSIPPYNSFDDSLPIDRVGRIYGKISIHLDSTSSRKRSNRYINTQLVSLGVPSSDVGKAKELLKAALKADLVFKHIGDNQSFAVEKDGKIIGYFKHGHKRVNQALVLKDISYSLGLESTFPTYLPIVVRNLFSGKQDFLEFEEPLWNGYIKAFATTKKGLDKDHKVLGVLESPVEKKDVNTFEFSKLILSMLVFGLRDMKDENVVGGKIIDSEECFYPFLTNGLAELNILPSVEMTFSDKQLDQILTKEDFAMLKKIVDKWDVDAIVNKAKKMQIGYRDEISEQMVEEDKIFVDSGGCRAKLVVDEIGDEINKYSVREINVKKAFTKKQILTLKKKLVLLKHFFSKEQKDPKVCDIIYAVDKLFEVRRKALLSSRESTISPDSVQRFGGTTAVACKTPVLFRSELDLIV